MTTRFEVISAILELFQGQKAEQAVPLNVGGTILSLIWTSLGSGLTAKTHTHTYTHTHTHTHTHTRTHTHTHTHRNVTR